MKKFRKQPFYPFLYLFLKIKQNYFKNNKTQTITKLEN